MGSVRPAKEVKIGLGNSALPIYNYSFARTALTRTCASSLSSSSRERNSSLCISARVRVFEFELSEV